jgi:hypothetical protein
MEELVARTLAYFGPVGIQGDNTGIPIRSFFEPSEERI